MIRNNCNYTHKVEAKSTGKFGAREKGLACPGVDKYSGKKWEMITEKLPETVLSRKGLFTDKGKVVIFTVATHSENDGNGTGSTRQRRGRWIYLDRSYG